MAGNALPNFDSLTRFPGPRGLTTMTEEPFPSACPGLKSPLRIGLIGVTGYAYAYMEGIEKLVEGGRAVWAAVTIVNPEEAAEQLRYFQDRGIPIYSDYGEMLEREKGNLDWVCVPTAIGWHTRMTVDCLQRGLHVLVEKPLAATLQDVDVIQNAEKRSGLKVGVGFQHLFLDHTWEIKERLLAGEIGTIERIDCIALWPRSCAYYERNTWGGELHDGGAWVLDSPLQNGLSHLVNLILFWAGETLEDRARIAKLSAELYRSKAISSFDTIRSVATMENGIEAAVVLSHSSSNSIDPEIRITGSLGSLSWRFWGYHTFRVAGEERVMETPGLIAIRENMFERMVDLIEGKSARICTTEQAKGACLWVNAAHDTAPIADIPPEYRDTFVSSEGERFEAISDLEYYALRAYKENLSFKEAGAPWAVEAQQRDLSGYAAFEGHHLPEPIPAILDPKAYSESRS